MSEKTLEQKLLQICRPFGLVHDPDDETGMMEGRPFRIIIRGADDDEESAITADGETVTECVDDALSQLRELGLLDPESESA